MSLGETSAFGRYRLIREIGRGGEAIVHLAEDPVLKRRVAVKIFPRAVAATGTGPPPAFRREMEVLSRLRHPGICTVHDAGIEDGSPFIAMSFVEGRTLASDAPLAEHEAARIGEGVARVIAAAHAASIVHGDLKPANVIVTPEGRCVVLDFGVARLMDDATQAQTSNRFAGTLPYLAPECLSRPPDARADIYGLGAVLYDAIAGRPPHTAPTRAALLGLIQKEHPPLLRSVVPGASRDLEAVLAKAIDRDPTRRYATMEDFAADLARIRRGEPSAARPLGTVARGMRWARRHPAGAALLAFASMFLGVGAVVTVVKNQRLGEHLERASGETRRADSARSAAQEHLARYAWLADRRRVADLDARAARLVPPQPDTLPALEAWLAEARALARRLGEHREALAELRSRAQAAALPGLPGSAAIATPLTREIASMKGRYARMAASNTKEPAEPYLRDLIRRLEGLLPPQVETRSYASEGDAWRDEALTALIADLERFADPDPHRGTMADVEQRIAEARTIEASLAEHEAAWRTACRSIANESECPRYAGLVIAPQLGLVPLRRDATSGLWEFLHVLSGVTPKGSPEGTLDMRPESGIVLVLIPGGLTRVGAKRPGPADPREGAHLDAQASPDESPPTTVMLDPFFISKFEMTYAQWVRIAGRHSIRRTFASDNELTPAAPINWNEASRTLLRIGLELPTEAQWEHAARAGTTTPWWTGADPASLTGAAAFALRDIQPIGRGRPNAFGLHDVLGNASEWCRDVYNGSRSHAPGTGEYPPDTLDLRVRRGGEFSDGPPRLRSTLRRRAPPSHHTEGSGARPARRVFR